MSTHQMKPVDLNINTNVAIVPQEATAVAIGGDYGSPAFANAENEAVVNQANQSAFFHQFGVII
jgi:hypothetical protein